MRHLALLSLVAAACVPASERPLELLLPPTSHAQLRSNVPADAVFEIAFQLPHDELDENGVQRLVGDLEADLRDRMQLREANGRADGPTVAVVSHGVTLTTSADSRVRTGRLRLSFALDGAPGTWTLTVPTGSSSQLGDHELRAQLASKASHAYPWPDSDLERATGTFHFTTGSCPHPVGPARFSAAATPTIELQFSEPLDPASLPATVPVTASAGSLSGSATLSDGEHGAHSLLRISLPNTVAAGDLSFSLPATVTGPGGHGLAGGFGIDQPDCAPAPLSSVVRR